MTEVEKVLQRGTMPVRRRGVRWWAGLAAMLCAVGVSGLADAADDARTQQLFKMCTSCHGLKAEGNKSLEAPAIAGLPQWYIEAQLGKFRKGMRGYHASDGPGLRMKPMSRALPTEEDVKSVAAYVAAMPVQKSASTAGGNKDAGQASYMVCMACHGDKGQGNQALKAPPINQLDDWYLINQLHKFKGRARGAHPDDAEGAQMLGMVATLADENAVRDVVAYIKSLNP